MKHIKAFILTILSITFLSCDTDYENTFQEIDTVHLNSQKAQNCTICPTLTPVNIPVFSKNELIIQYAQELSENQKNYLRTSYNESDPIESFEVCMYCDGTIEKWTYGPSIDLEHKKASIRSRKKSKPEGLINVDTEFTFTMENESLASSSTTSTTNYFPYISNNNNDVVIAVLDSGIDYNYPYFVSPYLYNSSIASPFYPSGSGWNFITNTDGFLDDYNLKHGTKVSYIINKTLDNLGVNHQILPIKVSSSNGSASYFKILCGINFTSNKANIVQMSFGWYGEDEDNDIFKDLIHRNSNILYVTSAGNNATNTDEKYHFPSGFEYNNILSIAAINTAKTDIALFSNYGEETVDFYAPGENIAFPVSSTFTDSISGTSFAAPYVSAIAAKILNTNRTLTPSQLENRLILYGAPLHASNPLIRTKHEIIIN